MEDHKERTQTKDQYRPTGPLILLREKRSLGEIVVYKPTKKLVKVVSALTIAASSFLAIPSVKQKTITVLTSVVIAGAIHAAPSILFFSVRGSSEQIESAGPGDIVSGASAFWSLRGYTASYTGKSINVCLPADLACVDVFILEGNLNLGTIANLGCNNSTSICTIKTWYDQSGATTCSSNSCDLTQATGANRATLVLPGASNGCTATTLPCAKFNNVLGYSSANNITSIAQTYSISFVGTRTGNTSAEGDVIVCNSSLVASFFYGVAVNKVSGFAANTQNAPANDSVWHAVQMQVPTQIYVDGTLTGALSMGARTCGGGTAGPFLMSSTAHPLTGFISEVGVWPVSTSANNSALNTNQHAYWQF